jgi:hypothetical protein
VLHGTECFAPPPLSIGWCFELAKAHERKVSPHTVSINLSDRCVCRAIVHISTLTQQRQRELEALYGTHAWDVELVEDEQWGRVLVAQRDFFPGEVIIRSAAVLHAQSAAELVHAYDELMRVGVRPAVLGQFIDWATSSPRCVRACVRAFTLNPLMHFLCAIIPYQIG